MADTKASAFGNLTPANAAVGDKIPIIDISQGAVDAACMHQTPLQLSQTLHGFNPPGLMPDFRITGLWHGPEYTAVNQTLTLNTTGREYYVPIFIPTRMTLSSIALVVTTIGNTNAKLALYASVVTSDGGMKVGAKVADGSAAINLNSAVGVAAATVSPSVVVEPGWYFMGLITDGTGAIIRAIAANGFGSLWGAVAASATNTLSMAYYRAGTYATGLVDMTALTPAGTLSQLGSNTPLILLKP